MNLTDKHVVVLGAGRSGRAAAQLAHQAGAKVRLYDGGQVSHVSGLADEIELIGGASESLGRTVESDVLVISPGIDTYGSFVKAFAENTGELIGETELACRFFNGKIVAITGTNGKTTTTELVQRILTHAGISCVACGNYGVPFSEVVLADEVPDAVALEVSSFQLETIVEFKPNVAIWLNFSADHMDRYRSLDDYKKAKLRVFENQTAEDFAIVRAGEEVGSLAAEEIRFTSENSDVTYGFDGQKVLRNGEPVLDLRVTHLRGLHNAENAMAAVAACACLGVEFSEEELALKGFAPPLHRCELIRTLDGVEYINDSKATNLHALDSALRSLSRPIVLIAGGKQKGLDYTELLPRIQGNAHAAVVFGEIGEDLASLFSQVVPTEAVSSLDAAVSKARELARHGDTILFSPGTSSFDQFPGYEARGDHFRKLVNNLR